MTSCKKNLFLLSICFSFISNAQQKNYYSHTLEESTHDPYLAPDPTKKLLAKPPFFSGFSVGSMGSNMFTRQVNVDGNGWNIAGDAANEPNIAINPNDTNKIVIGWRQFDNISSNFRQAGWAYTNDGGNSWTFPGVIEPGVFRSDPVLDYDVNGNFFYNSLTADSILHCTVFKSTDGGQSWDSGVEAFGGDKQWMAIDRTTTASAGSIYNIWTPGISSCAPAYFNRSLNAGASFDTCTTPPANPYHGMIEVSSNGDVYAAGSNVTNQNFITLIKSQDARLISTAPTWTSMSTSFIPGNSNSYVGINPQGLAGQTNLCIDKSGGTNDGDLCIAVTRVLASSGDSADVYFTKSTTDGSTWLSPAKLNDDNTTGNYQWFTTMSVAPNGRIDVIWLDTRDNPGTHLSSLYYTYSLDGGNTWTSNERLSSAFNPHIGYPNQNKIGDYFDMISTNGGAHLAWAATFNGEQDVYYSYITPSYLVGNNLGIYNRQFVVYPNPSNDVISIRADQPMKEVIFFNNTGAEVLRKQLSENNSVSTKELSAGLYYIKINFSNGSSGFQKFIKTEN